MDTPVLIITGRRDTIVPLVNAEILLERLPRSKLALIDAGRCAWADAPDHYAALIGSWWNGGYVAAVRVGGRPRAG